MISVNPLPVIGEWLAKFNSTTHANMKRKDLHAWLTNTSRPGYHTLAEIYGLTTEAHVDLMIDCLIAAGIGRDAEQGATVYCHCTSGG